jgi:AAA+ ATPase superfamily predicted ATPase
MGSFFTKHEKKGRCFFAEGSKTVCEQISRIVKKYITVIYMSRQLFHTSNITKYSHNKVTKYYYIKVYSSLRIFSAASFNNLSTTSSIIEFAILLRFSASFISKSARGLYGSGSGDSSAVEGKLLVRNHKVSIEVKIQKQYLCAFPIQQPLQFA